MVVDGPHGEHEPVGDLDQASLSRFSLDGSRTKLRMLSDGSLESELLVRSFSIYDSRPRDSDKYRRIMTSLNKDAQQLMASVSLSGGDEKRLVAVVTLDSPRVIFALAFRWKQLRIKTGAAVESVSAHHQAL